MNKKWIIKISIVLTVVVLLSSAILVYYFGATYPYYDSIKAVEFAIPGLSTSFVPQGFCFDGSTSNYFISGYMSNEEDPSRLYCLPKGNESQAKYVTLLVNNEENFSHFGGVAVYNNNIWVCGDKWVYRVSKQEVLNAQNGKEIEIVDCFKTDNGADSVTIYDNKLWVGEFYRKKSYETPVSHHIEISQTEKNKALALAYEIDESKEFGIASTTPVCGMSLPNQCQGFDFTADGRVIVSTSYAIAKSHILIYENVINSQNIKNVNLYNTNFSVYMLSSKNLKQNIEAPSMSEEVVVKEDRLFILYESACKKYRLANRTRVENVHSISI